MFCKNCGANLEENDVFCTNCGTKVEKLVGQEEKNEVEQPVAEENIGVSQNNVVVEEETVNPVVEPIKENTEQSKNTTKSKKDLRGVNKGGVIIACVVGVILVLCMIIPIIFLALVGIGIAASGEYTSNEIDRPSVSNNSSNSGYTNVSTNSKSTYKVEFNGFELKIPDDFVYEKDEEEGVLYVTDEDEDWMAQIEIIEGSFSQISSNKSQLKSLYEEQGYTSSVAKEKTVDGVKFIYNELSYSGTNFIAAIAKANSMNTFAITLFDIDNEFDEDLLEKVSSIVNSASYVGTSSNKIESNVSLQFDKVTELGK